MWIMHSFRIKRSFAYDIPESFFVTNFNHIGSSALAWLSNKHPPKLLNLPFKFSFPSIILVRFFFYSASAIDEGWLLSEFLLIYHVCKTIQSHLTYFHCCVSGEDPARAGADGVAGGRRGGGALLRAAARALRAQRQPLCGYVGQAGRRWVLLNSSSSSWNGQTQNRILVSLYVQCFSMRKF